jgi:hypothetical protein
VSKKKRIETNQDLVNVLADLFDEINENTDFSEQELDEILHEAGYDPSEVAIKAQTVIEDALANSPLNWRNRAQQELEETRTRFQQMEINTPSDRVELLEAIQQILDQLGGTHKQALAHFRNFESTSDEDLASMLVELRFLAETDEE